MCIALNLTFFSAAQVFENEHTFLSLILENLPDTYRNIFYNAYVLNNDQYS